MRATASSSWAAVFRQKHAGCATALGDAAVEQLGIRSVPERSEGVRCQARQQCDRATEGTNGGHGWRVDGDAAVEWLREWERNDRVGWRGGRGFKDSGLISPKYEGYFVKYLSND